MAAINAGAPAITDRLCDACAGHFAAVRAHLDVLGVGYRIEPSLVRGLDYYTRTAFEFYLRGREGQQQALGGGGRYDGLVELLGGKPTPGIGFGIGLDRVVLALEEGSAGRRQGADAGRRRRRAPTRPRPPSDSASPRSCAPPACGSGRSWATGSSPGSSRRPRVTAPISRSSSATSSPRARSS